MTKTTATTTTDTRIVVRLDDVSKSYQRGIETVMAVNRATVAVTAGSFTAISGPSGSGKTTLLNLLIGWELPDTGTRTPSTAATVWADLAVIPQRLGLIDHCTIEENITLPGRVNALEHDPDQLMERLGIHHLRDRFPQESSLGEQQRTAIARAVICRPQLLVADEPTSHQDDINTERITRLLADAARHGTAVVVATHDQRIDEHATHHHHIIDGHLTTTRADNTTL